MDELAGSRAYFKAPTGHVEDEGGDESRRRSYRSTGGGAFSCEIR